MNQVWFIDLQPDPLRDQTILSYLPRLPGLSGSNCNAGVDN